MAVVQNQLANPRSEDENMDGLTDQRVTQLESQVSALADNLTQLTGSMTSFKQQQQTHNTQVAHQVQALKTQADQQEHTMKVAARAEDGRADEPNRSLAHQQADQNRC